MPDDRIDPLIAAFRKGVAIAPGTRDPAPVIAAAQQAVAGADLQAIVTELAGRLVSGGLPAPDPRGCALAFSPWGADARDDDVLSAESELSPGKAPRFAFVMANLNDARWLPRSLKGICEQRRPPDQVLVVDDGSSDDSIDLIAGFQARHGFLSLRRNPQNRGTLSAIADHWSAVDADYVVFAAADDLVGYEFLAEMERMVRRHPTVGAVQAMTYVWFPASGRAVVDAASPQISRLLGPHTPGEYRRLLLGGGLTIQGNVACFRKSLIDRLGLFDTDLEHIGDTFLFQRALLAGGVCYSPAKLGIFTRHDAQYSTVRMADAGRRGLIHGRLLERLQRPEHAGYRADLLRHPVLLENYPGLLADLCWETGAWDLLLSYADWSGLRRTAAEAAAL